MPTTIGKKFSFEAAHWLPNVPDGHKCKSLHGHSYTAELIIEGDVDENGLVVDFAEISRVAKPLFAQLDHSLLNDHLPNPTSELLARFIFENLKPSLPGLSLVSVSETPNTKAEYYEY